MVLGVRYGGARLRVRAVRGAGVQAGGVRGAHWCFGVGGVRGWRWQAARPNLRLVPIAVGSLLSNYGWYILLACVVIYVIVQKISQSLAARQGGRAGAVDAADIGQ